MTCTPALRVEQLSEKHTDRAEPFKAGNAISIRHGANSPRMIALVEAQILPLVVERAPWLADPMYEAERSRYARAAAKAELLDEFIFHVAAEKGIGAVPARTLEQSNAATNTAAKLAEKLGITVTGHAALRKLVAETTGAERSLAGFVARGQAIDERRALAAG